MYIGKRLLLDISVGDLPEPSSKDKKLVIEYIDDNITSTAILEAFKNNAKTNNKVDSIVFLGFRNPDAIKLAPLYEAPFFEPTELVFVRAQENGAIGTIMAAARGKQSIQELHLKDVSYSNVCEALQQINHFNLKVLRLAHLTENSLQAIASSLQKNRKNIPTIHAWDTEQKGMVSLSTESFIQRYLPNNKSRTYSNKTERKSSEDHHHKKDTESPQAHSFHSQSSGKKRSHEEHESNMPGKVQRTDRKQDVSHTHSRNPNGEQLQSQFQVPAQHAANGAQPLPFPPQPQAHPSQSFVPQSFSMPVLLTHLQTYTGQPIQPTPLQPNNPPAPLPIMDVRTLVHQLDEAKALAEQRGQRIARLEHELKEANEYTREHIHKYETALSGEEEKNRQLINVLRAYGISWQYVPPVANMPATFFAQQPQQFGNPPPHFMDESQSLAQEQPLAPGLMPQQPGYQPRSGPWQR